MIDGDGGPASTDFADAIAALYPVAFNLKFSSKTHLAKDYVVPPLEALWWAQDMTTFTTQFDQSQCLWSALILCPDWIDASQVQVAVETVAAKKALPMLEQMRLETLSEGRCVQTLHLGPYSDEGPVLKRMHEEVIPQANAHMLGKHHEIYFNDFHKVAPEKLRTILRQPIR